MLKAPVTALLAMWLGGCCQPPESDVEKCVKSGIRSLEQTPSNDKELAKAENQIRFICMEAAAGK